MIWASHIITERFRCMGSKENGASVFDGLIQGFLNIRLCCNDQMFGGQSIRQRGCVLELAAEPLPAGLEVLPAAARQSRMVFGMRSMASCRLPVFLRRRR